MLKSKLLASTIIVTAAAAVAAAPVSAAKLKLSGYYEAWAGVGADGTATQMNNFDVKHDSEVNFDWKQKLKNGLTVGGRMEMKAGTGNSIGTSTWDETSMYVSGSFGKVTVGNNDPAAAMVGGLKGVGPVGAVKSDAGDWVGLTNAQTVDNDNDAGMGDMQKIIYQPPKMGALSMAVSYMPDNSDGTETDYDDNETSGLNDGVSAMAKYSGKAGKAKYSIAAGYSQVDNGSGATPDGWNLNVTMAQGASTVTFILQDEDNGSGQKDKDLGVAFMHKLNKADTVSLQYGIAEKQPTSGSDNKTTVTTAGYSKNLGGGVKFEGSIFNVDVDNGSGSSDNVSETGVVAGFKVKF